MLDRVQSPACQLADASLLLSCAVAATAFSQEIQRLDPAVDLLVPRNAMLEKVATGFNKWTEGPVWTREGTLLFAEIPANNIDQWIPGKIRQRLHAPQRIQGSGAIQGAGAGFERDDSRCGRPGQQCAGHAGRNVWRMESVDPRAQITVLADSYQGKKLNSPNDLVYKSDGSLYFTDPPYGLPTQSDTDPLKELQVNGVYRLPGARAQKAGRAAGPGQAATDHQGPAPAQRHGVFAG